MRLSRPITLFGTTLLSLAFSAALAQSPSTDPPTSFDRVEEDWDLVVATPDPVAVGPQITTCMVPTGGANAPFVAFDMNYHEFPFFFPGGMQLQVWSNGRVVDTSAQGWGVLNTPGEHVTWTQRLRVNEGRVYYDIDNGQSTTWGQFGQGEHLTVDFPSPTASLEGYDPDVSAARSGVSWESNHVTSLKILRVRYYSNGQLLWTDENPRVIYTADAQ